MFDDIPLRKAQIIWDYHGGEPDAPKVRVVGPDCEDDTNYFSSWGSCNSDFNQADDAQQLNMLFRQFHWMVVSRETDPMAAHSALLVIPEYRSALPNGFLPTEYRTAED